MKRKQQKIWAQAVPRPVCPDTLEKQALIAACEALITDVLKPRFQPTITPTEFNYPIDIRGDWRAGRYRFLRLYRFGHSTNEGMEFDAPFARIDRIGSDRFDINWMRHIGTWYRV
ncbi:MAG TPA: hypothetical protein VGC82_07145, partial [Rhodopila sp.]